MSSEIYMILCLSFITPLCLFLLLKKRTPKNLPPGPKKVPIIGNIHQVTGNLPHRSFQELSKTYGDLMLLHLGSIPTLIVSSADAAREIFKSHDLAISGRPRFYVGKQGSFVTSCTITLAPYGEYWRQVKKIAVLELLSAKRVQSFAKIRDQEVGFMIQRVREHDTDPVNLSSSVFLLSNNVICQAAFGTASPDGHGDRDGRMNKFQQMLIEMMHLAAENNIANVFPWLAWVNKFNGVERKFDKNFRETHAFFDKVIQEHRNPERPKPDQEDIIDVLLRIQKDPNQEFKLKDEHVKGVLGDIFSAGSHTSSTTIEWTMAELIRNPQVKEKTQHEVRKACKGKVKVEENDLQKLKYLKLVIKESLRLHPPAPLLVPRETKEDCIINEKFHIPARTQVIFNAAAIGTDPKYWENPEKFYPERFLDNDVDFRGHHFELLPFGAGRRGCPGINFGISLVELAIANLLFSFDWELPRGMSAQELDMEEALGITVNKKIPLCLVASPPTNDIH